MDKINKLVLNYAMLVPKSNTLIIGISCIKKEKPQSNVIQLITMTGYNSFAEEKTKLWDDMNTRNIWYRQR